MAEQPHSTGRGGAGNIGKDDTPYVDAGVVREGNPNALESTGRGGAGNIGTPQNVPADKQGSADVIPETNLVPAQDDYHTGRGGEGNVHREKYGGHSKDPSTHKSVPEKIKGLFSHEKKEGENK